MIEETLKSLINTPSEERGLQFSSNIKANVDSLSRGKDYPGFKPLLTYRALAWNSTVVYSIIIFRRNQVLKKEKIVVPYNHNEPPFKFNLFEYTPESLIYLPSIDDADAFFLINLFRKYKLNNDSGTVKVKELKTKLSPQEKEIFNHIEEKHIKYYLERIRDAKKFLDFLNRPDPLFSEENSWSYILSMILDDILTIDRGVLIKVRDERGKLVAITPVDGTTIKPVIDDKNGSVLYYVQEVDGAIVNSRLDKKDVILFRQNLTPDVYMYGYSLPPIEILYKVILSDIFIDKGNLDYYRKGGSIPEGIITVEPPSYKEGDVYPQLSREQLESIQRQLQAIMMGDYTQVPILSGGRFTWIDFKGKRRDMQFKELAEFVARKICAVYQVSPQDVGILEGTNRATAEVLASMTKAKGLEPLMRTIANGFDSVVEEFRAQKDFKLWFKEDDLEKEREWWNVIQGQLNTGFRTINEARMEKGLEPVPWGDVPFSGLRNWKPEEQQGGAKGLPGAGGMPGPIPGAMPGATPGAMPLGAVPSVAGGEGGNKQLSELSGALEKQAKGEGDKGKGLELLSQLFKSLGNDVVSTAIELAEDENYLKDEELLRKVLKSIGMETVVNFIDAKETVDAVIDSKDILNMNYRSKILNETAFFDRRNNLVLRLLANETVGYKELLEVIALHFDCSSTPKVNFFTNEGYKKAVVSMSSCVPSISSESYTDLDNLLSSLNQEKISRIEVVFDEQSFRTFDYDELSLLRYADLPEKIKEKNQDFIVFSLKNSNEEVLIRTFDLAEKVFEEKLLSNEVSLEHCKAELISFGPKVMFTFLEMLKFANKEKLQQILKGEYGNEIKALLLTALGKSIPTDFRFSNCLKSLPEVINKEDFDNYIRFMARFFDEVTSDYEYEKIRFFGMVNFLIQEFAIQEIKDCVLSSQYEGNYVSFVQKLIEDIENVFVQDLAYKTLFGEALEEENHKILVKSYLSKKLWDAHLPEMNS